MHMEWPRSLDTSTTLEVNRQIITLRFFPQPRYGNHRVREVVDPLAVAHLRYNGFVEYKGVILAAIPEYDVPTTVDVHKWVEALTELKKSVPQKTWDSVVALAQPQVSVVTIGSPSPEVNLSDTSAAPTAVPVCAGDDPTTASVVEVPTPSVVAEVVGEKEPPVAPVAPRERVTLVPPRHKKVTGK